MNILGILNLIAFFGLFSYGFFNELKDNSFILNMENVFWAIGRGLIMYFILLFVVMILFSAISISLSL